jgi:hypothetical protein
MLFFERCRSHNICQVKSLRSLQRFKLSSTFCIEARQTYTHLNSNRLVDQSGYSSGEVRVFSYQLARKTSALYGRPPSAVPDFGSREYRSCGLIAHDGGTPRAVSLSSSSP